MPTLAASGLFTVVVLFAASLTGSAPAPAAHETRETRETPATSTSTASTLFTGTVRDARSGSAIAGAVVSLDNVARATTDRAGRYSLRAEGLGVGGSVRLVVRAAGYATATHAVRVSGDSVRADLTLAASTPQPVATEQRAQDSAVRQETSARVAATVAPPPVANAVGAVAVASSPSFASAKMAAGGRVLADGGRPRRPAPPGHDREGYDRIEENPFLAAAGNPRSTFSIDVDRASYGNVRRFISKGAKPPVDAVRIEELVNYFPYTMASPRGRDPVAITTELAPAPWQPQHNLVRIALQARRIETAALPPSNLVFLIDVSGSMQSPDKLPLVKQSLRLLVDQLREQDRVAIVVYAGAAGLVLPSTHGDDKVRITRAIDALEAGGSTAGGAGIELAYRVAREGFLPGGNNRVILATDGDFNVGASSDAEMERLIERKRAEGTYLTVLGFGTGNYQDAKMEKLAKKGNGNYAYVDDIAEARKTLVHEMGATLLTVANDVKLQVEFNPALVQAYRLIGYEDRLLRDEDFNDDRKDAGDIGAGHAVTALYEIVPVGVRGTTTVRGSDPLRYEPVNGDAVRTVGGSELLFVKLRYKTPGDSTSRLMTHPVSPSIVRRASDDFRFAASVASFGMLLRESEHRGSATVAGTLESARGALGDDPGGYRADFVRLVERWRDIGRLAGRE